MLDETAQERYVHRCSCWCIGELGGCKLGTHVANELQFTGWRLLRKKSSLPNGFPRNTRDSDRDSNSEGSDSARTQIEFPTWNSHESTQKFLDTAEDKKYYRIWIDPVDTVDKTKARGGGGDRFEQTTLLAENPPPLPPRSHHMKHRPLERTKALEHGSISPPKVSRHQKPFYGTDGAVPAVPPRPKKLVNPEDAFNFEIIDIDEQSELKHARLHADTAPLATPEDCGLRGMRKVATNNHSSQNCDIKVNGVMGWSTSNHLSKLHHQCNGNVVGADIAFRETPTCFLAVPDSGNSSISPNSGNSANSASTPTSDSGIALGDLGYADYSSSSTESEFESTRAHRDSNRSDALRGHKVLSRQISHPPDNCVSQFLHARNTQLQCPPTPTHRARKFQNNDISSYLSPVPRRALRNGIAAPSPTSSPFKTNSQHNVAPAASNSSDSDSDVSSRSLRKRTMRLPSISENTRIVKVDTLPDGDGLPPGE